VAEPLNADYTSQIWRYVGAPAEGQGMDPNTDPVLKYLLDNGLLQATRGDSEGGNKIFDFGVNAPSSLVGYGSNNVSSAKQGFTHVTGDQNLGDSKAVIHSDLWGDVTPFANVIPNENGFTSNLVKYGPAIVGGIATVASGGAAAPWWVSMMESMAKAGVNYSMMMQDMQKSGKNPYTGQAGLDFTGITQGGKQVGPQGSNTIAAAGATTAAGGKLPPELQQLVSLYKNMGYGGT
jgi:hypothetical protein